MAGIAIMRRELTAGELRRAAGNPQLPQTALASKPPLQAKKDWQAKRDWQRLTPEQFRKQP